LKIPEIFLNYFFILPALVFNGCAYDKRELAHPNTDTTFVNCDTSASVTYTSFVKSMVKTNCTFSGCHGADAPPGFDYTLYDNIKAKVDTGAFQIRVLDKKEMPPPNSPGQKSLDTCTLYKLQKWVNNLAPE
jgi:hypothetical protein